MRRVAVSSVLALVLGLGGCGGGGPDEVAIAQIPFSSSGSASPPFITGVVRFSLSADSDFAGTNVLEGVGVTPADQGRTFTISQADDPQFAGLRTILTNGVDDSLSLSASFEVGGLGNVSGESNLLVGLDPGFTGPDLTGFTLTEIRLVVDQYSNTLNGTQTQFQFSVRLVFVGTRP